MTHSIHLIEPITAYPEITKAKFKVIAPVSSKLLQQKTIAQRPLEELPKDHYRRLAIETAASPQVKFKGLFAKSNHNLSLVLKQEIIKQKAGNDRYLYSEVALVLEDICESVAKNKPYQPVTEPIVNRVEKERLQQKEIEEKQHEEAELRRKARSKFLKEQIKIMSQQKEKTSKEKSPEQEKASALQEKKKTELKKYYEEQKERATAHQEKIKMEKKAKEEEEKLRAQEERELKKKRFYEFNSKKIAELVNTLFRLRKY